MSTHLKLGTHLNVSSENEQCMIDTHDNVHSMSSSLYWQHVHNRVLSPIIGSSTNEYLIPKNYSLLIAHTWIE